MKTDFTAEQLTNPLMQMMEENLRKCVHCGFCLPSCPTYSVLGDERESPRGRIYLIKDMLESGDTPSIETISHVDSCLSCLACMSACPSGVDYQHYIDHARNYIEQHHQRPWPERLVRSLVVFVIPHIRFFRFALKMAGFSKLFSKYFGSRIYSIINMVPTELKLANKKNEVKIFPAEGIQIRRVALLVGCAQNVLRPSINEATIRLLTRMGMEVVVTEGVGCCGALSHHIGKENIARNLAKTNIDAWLQEFDQRGIDNIIINAAGCGTEVKDYAYMFKDDPEYKEKSKKISHLTKDICELLSEHQLPNVSLLDQPNIIYHDACSLMHGQGVTLEPREHLKAVGFELAEIPGRHFCCGSAGSYNLLQPAMAETLKNRRLTLIDKVSKSNKASILATGNIGCLMQLASGTGLHVVHTVELLDWATGGLKPPD